MRAGKRLLECRSADGAANAGTDQAVGESKKTVEEKLNEQGFVISRKFVTKKPHIYIDHVHKRWAVAMGEEEELLLYAFSDVLGCDIWENSTKICNALRVNIIVNDADHPLISVNLITFPVTKDSLVYKNEIACAQNIVSTFIYMKDQPSSAASASSRNIPEEIQQLAGLANEGILTKEEFDQKKAELLAKM